MNNLSPVKFDFAVFNPKHELIIRNSAYVTDNSDYISLKNGEYYIRDGVLYISAFEIFHGHITDYCEKYDLWSPRTIYLPNEKFLSKIENPPIVKEITIKRWLKKDLKFQGIELFEDDHRWYKFKEEKLIELICSNYVIINKK